MKYTLLVSVTLTGLFLVPGCADSATCDPDQVLLDGACWPKSAMAMDSGPEAPDAGPAMCSEDAGGTFGAACTDGETHSECACPAHYCAIQPGEEEGFCTTTGCVEDPGVCPDGWECFDLSMFDPNLPSFCMRP